MMSVNRVLERLHFELPAHETNEYELFVGNHPSKVDQSCIKTKESTFALEFPMEKAPYYFKYQNSDGQFSPVFSERVLPLKGTINVRDLGGYRVGSKQIRYGLLFRGDQLSKITKNDQKILEQIGIRTIIDFRSEKERAIYPNVIPSTVERIIFCNPNSALLEAAGQTESVAEENRKLVLSLENGCVEEKYFEDTELQVKEDYIRLVLSKESQKAYTNMIQEYVHSNHAPIIQHCRGGKDRTGFGSALLLGILGVTREDIIKDYMLTAIVRESRNKQKMKDYRELTSNDFFLRYIEALFSTRSSYIESALDLIDKEYGSIEKYSQTILGLSNEDIQQLRRNFLEEVII